MNADIFEKVNQMINGCDTAYLGVIDESGSPTVSTAITEFSTTLDERLLSMICYQL
jgi:hypothetical protein